MQKLCFATNNPHKLREVRQVVKTFQVIGLQELGCTEEIPETRPTIAGNSEQKAEYVWQHYQASCFADDTGLEVQALNGGPGVYSARYAGPERDADKNMGLLLKNLEGKGDRSARFVTVITLILKGEKHFFEGVVRGQIITEKRGNGGFGYDPIFVPTGYNLTFAELPAEEKNKISHRGRAVAKLIEFLNTR